MAELQVTISPSAHETLMQLAKDSGEPIQTTLDKAIEAYRRYIFLTQANQAFAELRKNQEFWQDELMERQAWDTTLIDLDI